ncbi:MAG: FixH family protein [Solirubrobacterales bacterium]|nr:FixH family protein [Solirubrobacterales bacterium]
MKRLASAATVLGLGALVVACGNSEDDRTTAAATTPSTPSKACPRQAAADASYASRFEAAVSMSANKHVLRVTKDGRPLSGAAVCVNTAMVGMRSMRYSARGRELAPGRYEVGVKFAMQGTYRGNVVTTQDGREISIPVTVKVGSHDMKSGKGSGMDDTMKSHTTTSGDTMDTMTSDGR